jgi:hypothetical protein
VKDNINEVWAQVLIRFDSQVLNQAWIQVNRHVWNKLKNKVDIRVRDFIKTQLEKETKDEMNSI